MEKLFKIINTIYTFLAKNMKNKVFRNGLYVLLAILIWNIIKPVVVISAIGFVAYKAYSFFKNKEYKNFSLFNKKSTKKVEVEVEMEVEMEVER